MLNEESRMNFIVNYAAMVLWCMCHEQKLNGISHINFVLVQAKNISDYGLTIHIKTVEMQSFSHVPYHKVCSNYMLGIMEVWDFLPNNITQAPASHFLYSSLAALVRHSQASD